MFKKTNLVIEKQGESVNHLIDKKCQCNDDNQSYKILENYRSILDRKQQLISSWKIVEDNSKIKFTHGSQSRKGADALVIRSNHICLINPWYKYIDVNKHLLSVIKQNQCDKVFEIILLECNCSTDSQEYELGIIECPCLEQLRTYCTYCRLTLAGTEQSDRMLKNVSQQTNISFSVDFFNDDMNINGSFYSRSGPYRYQRTVQIQVESEKILHAIIDYEKKSTDVQQQTFDEDGSLLKNKQYLLKSISSHSPDAIESNEGFLFDENTSEISTKYITRGTQTKLHAILLPQSPLSEMKKATIEERTSRNATRTCQVNTLSYLIKTNDIRQTNLLSTKTFLKNKTRLMKDLLTQEKGVNMKLLTEKNYQTLIDRQRVNVPAIEFEDGKVVDEFEERKINSALANEEDVLVEGQPEEFISISAPLKCVNAFDDIDSDKYPRAMNTTDFELDDTELKISKNNVNNNNNSSEQSESIDQQKIVKLSELKMNRYRWISRKRQRYRNKKRICGFIRRLRRRKRRNITLSHSSEHCSSSFIITIDPQNHSPSTQTNTNSRKTSSNRQQQSAIDLHLNNTDSIHQFKARDHTIVARASKSSEACKQLQTLLTNNNTSLEELIYSQLILTCHDSYRSVCILIDDPKQSKQYRSLFLHHIYTTLSNTLAKILNNESIQLTCMNLVYFNNSLCDIINMQRLRLIDTGKKILLLPSCEMSLQTSDDINTAMNRLSTEMLFAHQIFIINCYHKQSSGSGSFLFLQLAPITSIRPTGLLTNLNSSTYSVLNLIRQLSNGRLLNDNTTKRYLLNDCSLNRLLKSYLIPRQQTMTVITVKPKI